MKVAIRYAVFSLVFVALLIPYSSHSEINNEINKKNPIEKKIGEQYFPMKVGSRWVYQQGESKHIKTVNSEVMFGGKSYSKITMEYPGGQYASYYRVDKSGLYIILDSDQPDKGEILVKKFPFIDGASGTFTNKNNRVVKWRVESAGKVSVNNKKYDNCLKLTSVIYEASGTSINTTTVEYLAPNVGVIKLKIIPEKLHEGETIAPERVLIEYKP